ncbi:MAG: SIMPL domain-containing protein [Parcubacteria group bacterium]|nr:SIMPL domain-containing protein [Parcubacteria group bacterium]
MHPIVKNILGIVSIIFIIVVGALGIKTVFLYARSVAPTSFRNFTVSGDGKAFAVPDVAQFEFSVITEGGKDIAKLQQENTDRVNGAIAFLRKNNVEEKDIRTYDYRVDPRYQYYSCPPEGACPPQEIVGYTVTQTVSVKVRKYEAVGTLLAGVVQNGANSVSQLAFILDDPTKVQNEAREEAITKAKTKADALARAGDFALGRLLSIEETGTSPPRPFSELGIGGGGKGDVPSIQPGSQEVTVTVTLKYEMR